MAATLFFSSTGIAYLLLFISLAFLTYRFYQYWQKNRDTTSKVFLLFIFLLTLFAFIRAISGLFFATNIDILIATITLASFLQALAAAVAIFIVVHLKFPKTSPWLGFSIVFILGAISTAMTYSGSWGRQISFESFGAISWGLPSMGLVYALTRMLVLALAFIPITVILIQQGRVADESYLKKKSYGLSVVLFLGIIIGLLDFFFIEILGYNAIIRDIVMAILSIILFLVIYFTQKPPSEIK